MIIAVDFDGTLQIDGKPNEALFARLRQDQRRGHIIILWTSRGGNRLVEAVEFMRQNGLAPNYVNQNVPQMIQKLGYDSRKIFADVYIDDKAVRA